MGKKDKRAKRAKLKAKATRISKNNTRNHNSAKNFSYMLNPSSIELFESLAELNSEADRVAVLSNHLSD